MLMSSKRKVVSACRCFTANRAALFLRVCVREMESYPEIQGSEGGPSKPRVLRRATGCEAIEYQKERKGTNQTWATKSG